MIGMPAYLGILMCTTVAGVAFGLELTGRPHT